MSSFIKLLLFLFIVLPALSMHACNARRLGLLDKDIGHQKAKPHVVPSTHSRPKHSISGESLQASSVGAHKEHLRSRTLLKSQVSNGQTSGHEIIIPSSSHLDDLAVAIKTDLQGSKRLARSMLGHIAPHDSEEIVDDSKENDVVEDVVVMDYAQPHRKPPIHNEKN